MKQTATWTQNPVPPFSGSLTSEQRLISPLGFGLILGVALLVESLALASSPVIGAGQPTAVLMTALALNVLAVGLYAFRQQAAAVGVVIMIALLILPVQAQQIGSYQDYRSESAGIVQFAEAVRAEQGSYPTDLSGYTFSNPDLGDRLHVHGIYSSPTRFALSYQLEGGAEHIYFADQDRWVMIVP